MVSCATVVPYCVQGPVPVTATLLAIPTFLVQESSARPTEVTFTIYFMLVRLLNPDKTPAQIYDFLVRGSARQIRSRALRLNKWVVETLRRYERGELEYGPVPMPRPRRATHPHARARHQ